MKREEGQALVLLLGALVGVVVLAAVLGATAAALGGRADRQRAADLAALAGARAMRDAYARLFPVPGPGGQLRPALSHAAYARGGREAALVTARRNGVRRVRAAVVEAPGGAPPVRIRVTVADPLRVGELSVANEAVAEAELAPPADAGLGPLLSGNPGEYRGPFATRQGKPMRPDVALAFDRLAAAARGDGMTLVIASAFRSDAEQARLFAAHPDPRWVAPPGRSLHRLGTELDLGPPAAYAWLEANAPRFGFTQRYSWERWHWGWTRNAGSTSVGYGGRPAERRRSGLPTWVPDRFASLLTRAAIRWNVSSALLAAQLHQESGFDPRARSPAGALGIAQFLPATARRYGLDNPLDPARAIDAQAHLMHDLLRQFASVPLALAAYNAGPARVAACGCVPAIPETTAYVAAILGLLLGAGDPLGAPAGGLEVRLVR